ncbi:MAG: FHA domain-containing protein [Anaerolineales bacterium]|nr:FHA domain-containing protein [Chloroflexota bacterium]MBL6980946.1 FHA domain-containing protein [Anaerolineales bacterium]
MSAEMENCPECGYENPIGTENCSQCGVNVLEIASTMPEIDLHGATMVDMEAPVLDEVIPPATLTLKTGKFAGRVYPLRKNQTLGREKCEIILRDPQMSRQHANIKYLDGKFLLIDLGSANHTFVNDEMVQAPKTLQAGDLIGVGNTDLLFSLIEDE